MFNISKKCLQIFQKYFKIFQKNISKIFQKNVYKYFKKAL